MRIHILQVWFPHLVRYSNGTRSNTTLCQPLIVSAFSLIQSVSEGGPDENKILYYSIVLNYRDKYKMIIATHHNL